MAHPLSHQYVHCSLRISILFLFAITAADVVPYGGLKKCPRTSAIVRIIFSFWAFEFSEDVLRNKKIIIGLNSFSNQRLIYLAPFNYTSLCIDLPIGLTAYQLLASSKNTT